jgi:putrescine transport system substrate-binding protein
VYDVFDNNDTLEAKLLATNSGYDVVFPSFIPYASRQHFIGVYGKLDRSKLQNFRNLQTVVTEKFVEAGGDLDYMAPIFWGTTGIAYNRTLALKALGNEEVSYDTLLNPEKISKLSRYGGVSFPEEFVDIFPQAGRFWSIPTDDILAIPTYKRKFQSIRKWIKKFSSSSMMSDMLTGGICVAIGPSDNAWRTMRAARDTGDDIRYVIPPGFGILWIDCACIPEKAPHKDNAEKFINFLLRPDVSAIITNKSGILTNVKGAGELYAEEITKCESVYPSDEIIKTLSMGNPTVSEADLKYHKAAGRAWSEIKMRDRRDD